MFNSADVIVLLRQHSNYIKKRSILEEEKPLTVSTGERMTLNDPEFNVFVPA